VLPAGRTPPWRSVERWTIPRRASGTCSSRNPGAANRRQLADLSAGIGARYQAARTRVLAGGDAASRGERELVALGTAHPATEVPRPQPNPGSVVGPVVTTDVCGPPPDDAERIDSEKGNRS
jgi:hypothetical protein